MYSFALNTTLLEIVSIRSAFLCMLTKKWTSANKYSIIIILFLFCFLSLKLQANWFRKLNYPSKVCKNNGSIWFTWRVEPKRKSLRKIRIFFWKKSRNVLYRVQIKHFVSKIKSILGIDPTRCKFSIRNIGGKCFRLLAKFVLDHEAFRIIVYFNCLPRCKGFT